MHVHDKDYKGEIIAMHSHIQNNYIQSKTKAETNTQS